MKLFRYLETQIGLSICNAPFEEIVNKALSFTWTRDPFDRLIAASATYAHMRLLTKDETIRKHIKVAVWD